KNADLVGAKFSEPHVLAIRIEGAATRRRVFRRRRNNRNLAGLRVDAADIVATVYSEVDVVVAIGSNIVDVYARDWKRLKYLELPARQIEPVDRVGAGILDPNLAVDLGMRRLDLGGLRVILVELRRQREGLECFGWRIKPGNAGLVRLAEPQVAILVGAQRERAFRRIRFQRGDGIFNDLSAVGIELSQYLLGKAIVPDGPV